MGMLAKIRRMHLRDGLSIREVSRRTGLSADFSEAPGDRMLNVRSGNYTATQVLDRSTVTTLIESVAGGYMRTSRTTDEDRLKTVTGFESGRVVSRQAWPEQRRRRDESNELAGLD